MSTDRTQIHDELTPEELDEHLPEALPERAVMSTLTMTGLDAAAGTVEAVGDGVAETASAPVEDPTATPAEPVAADPVTTTATSDDPAPVAT